MKHDKWWMFILMPRERKSTERGVQFPCPVTSEEAEKIAIAKLGAQEATSAFPLDRMEDRMLFGSKAAFRSCSSNMAFSRA